MRRLLLVWVGMIALAGCPGRHAFDAALPGDAATDAPVEVPEPDADQPPDVARCGTSAVPFDDLLGACAMATPVPDGGVPTPGRCTATIDTSSGATLRANDRDGTAVVIPNGQRIVPAPHRLPVAGFPLAMLRIPGTPFVVVSGAGIHTETLQVVDVSQTPPVVVPGSVSMYPDDGTSRAPALFYGLAYDPTAHLLYASGGGGNRIYAFDVDEHAGSLAANPGRTLDVGITEGTTGHTGGTLSSAYVAGLALSPDGAHLYAALQRGYALAIYATATPTAAPTLVFFDPTATATSPEPYAVVTRPGDPRHVYVSLWGEGAVAEVDVSSASITRTFPVGKNPEAIVFSPDGARMYVTASDSDAISVVDLSMPTANVTEFYLTSAGALRGVAPSSMAWGPNGRLYVVESGDNAVAVIDTTGATLRVVGRVPTEWFPTDVNVGTDGTLVITTGKGLGSGPNQAPDVHEIDDLILGSVSVAAPPSDSDLAAGDTSVRHDDTLMSGFTDVTCPPGAPYDFPVPRVGSTSASTMIRHVILIIRENKTYDALLGAFTPTTAGETADGDPTLTLFPQAQMPDILPNFLALANRFGTADNYYSNAEQSIQGHVRTSTGRSTDYVERTWLTTWGRGTRRTPDQGVLPVGRPEEGSILTAMANAHVTAQNWGEVAIDFTAAQFAGARYPGLFFDMTVHDMLKARAFADFIQGTNVYGQNGHRACELPSFTYILLPNDHTHGAQAGSVSPQSFIQDNDEATGWLIDALSHSPFWPDSLVLVIEDDPSDGGDHVDNHRSVMMAVSPWVRRGHVSHVHFDESSVHHTIELILGVPAHNAAVASAPPLYDLFTSTPDFTPYRYAPRHACETYNPVSGHMARAAAEMDFSVPDNAPGLSRMIWQMAHEGQPAPWRRVPDLGDADGDGE